MKSIFLLICAELFLACYGIAQDRGHAFDISADPVLINGKLYVFHMPYGTEGNQFLSGNNFMEGSLMIKGINYTGLKLNYDVYNQQVILSHEMSIGAINHLIVPDGWLQGFSLDGKNFRLIAAGNGTKKIFQVIGADSVQVLYGWKKTLGLSHVHGATNHVFSKPVRTAFLYMNGMLHQYRNNRSFYSLFESGNREKLKDYMKRNRINVRKADDNLMTSLVAFCNSI